MLGVRSLRLRGLYLFVPPRPLINVFTQVDVVPLASEGGGVILLTSSLKNQVMPATATHP